MRIVSRLFLITSLIAVLCSCATTPRVNPDITNSLSVHGVTGSTFEKVNSAWKLNYDDILNLVEKRVPTHIIISYLQSTKAIYQFSPEQLNGLRLAGASPQLTDYLQETRGFYARQRQRTARYAPGIQLDQYMNTPIYQDEQPFAYGAPEIDYWYDSAYEESLYSPFSFN